MGAVQIRDATGDDAMAIARIYNQGMLDGRGIDVTVVEQLFS